MPGLDFIVLGAQKAGTTTLWHLLRGHPQLALPPSKEAPFFSDDKRYHRGLEWYAETFFGARPAAALRGTVTPEYMTGGRSVAVDEIAARIAAALPDVKLLALLRDPVRRAISHHRMSVRRGLERRSLDRALSEQLCPGALEAARRVPSAIADRTPRGRAIATTRYIVSGEYGRILHAYRRHFAPTQMLLLASDELERDPAQTLARVLRYLGVDEDWRPDDVNARRMGGGDDVRVPHADMAHLLDVLKAALPAAPHDVFDIALEEWNTLADTAAPQLSEPLEWRLRRHFASDAQLLEADWGLGFDWAQAPELSRERAPGARPEVSLIVLVHETPEEAATILESIVRHTTGEYEVLLVDNGSSPAVASQLRELAEHFRARLQRNDDNLVFSVAMNEAVRVARADEVLLLNSDVVVTPNWLSTLRCALHSAPDIAAVGPRSNYMRTRQGGIWLDDSSPEGVERFARFFNYPDPLRRFEIDWLSGFALLLRRDVFEEIGGLDETKPWYGLEDQDLGERLWAASKRVICAGDVFVYHTGHRTFSLAGVNRTATRLGREPVPARGASTDAARLVRDGGLVFEVHDGVASHIETPHAVALMLAGRRIESANDGELDRLPVGPPISLVRVRGGDQVWLIHNGVRRPVTGDPQRIRRLPGLAMVLPGDLDAVPEGLEVAVENALPPVPEIPPLLPANPALIERKRLLDVGAVTDAIATALDDGRGYALIRLDLDEAAVLNQRIWPIGQPDLRRMGVRGDPIAAAATLRRAIIDADIVGITTNRDVFPGATLLELLLFHFELYPRQRCSTEIAAALLGVDPASGPSHAPPGPLPELLRDRPVAAVVPAAFLPLLSRRLPQIRDEEGLDIHMTLGLDDMTELDEVFLRLAVQRERYDAVLLAAELPSKPLAARLARDLDVVALDLGPALARRLHPRYSRAASRLIAARWDTAHYIGESAGQAPGSPHPRDGELLRARGQADFFYIEHGAARRVGDPALIAAFVGEPIDAEPAELAEIPRGAPVCVVHEDLTEPYVLLDGRKHPVSLGGPVIEVDDLTLSQIPDGSERRGRVP